MMHHALPICIHDVCPTIIKKFNTYFGENCLGLIQQMRTFINEEFYLYKWRRLFSSLIFFLAILSPTHEANASYASYCTSKPTLTFSPSLPSTISYKPVVGEVLYEGFLTYTATGCTSNGNYPAVLAMYISSTGSLVYGYPYLSIFNLDSLNGVSFSSKCGTVDLSVSYFKTFSNVTCTFVKIIRISVNSVTGVSGSTTAEKISSDSTLTTGWARFSTFSYLPSGVTGSMDPLGQAIQFIPTACTLTTSSISLTLPTQSVTKINTLSDQDWNNFTLAMNSCVNPSASYKIRVTFSYTKLNNENIIANTATTAAATNVGAQLGYNGVVIAPDTEVQLGSMSSATSYSYNLQYRFKKASSGSATAGNYVGAATFTMNYY